ncbi:MAG: NusG domain II-containing protein [Spirochaetaceae bacterium]|jgi:hypothetical protein|nr:NusG domain II-containing protein [Spirochaetaceae bacterium]
MKIPVKPLDIPVMLLALGLALGAAFRVYRGAGETSRAVIRGSGGARWIFPLDAAETVRVAGPLGETVVEIAGGRARVVSSPCENQTCVSAGFLHAAGAWTACLPNQVFLLVEGGGEGERDAVSW